jgi:hypothetical protein
MGRDILLPMLKVGAGWDGMGHQCHAPAALSPVKRAASHFAGYELVSKPSWTGVENLAKYWLSNPKISARRESLHRLRYPGLGPSDTYLLCSLTTHVWQSSVAYYRTRDTCHDSIKYFGLIINKSKEFPYA